MIWLPALMVLSSVKQCSGFTGRATVTSLTGFPDTPLPGDNFTLSVLYDLPSPAITGGTAAYSATLNYIPVYSETYPLCDQTSCPKEVGSNTETSVTTVPSGISGKLVTQVKWTDQDNNPVWCVETTFKI
jgi:hypothetical protein